MNNIVFKNVRILSVEQPADSPDARDVRIEGSRIVAIGKDLPSRPADTLIDGTGKLLMPGLINGHFHSPGSFNKGALDDMPLELFMLYEVPPFDCPPTPPRMHYLRTLLGAVEMLKVGVTAVHDDPFYVPYVTEDLTNATMQAYADAGIRATVSINMPNVIEYDKYPFLFDLLPEEFRRRMRESVPMTSAELISIYGRFISNWHNKSQGRLRASVSCSAPQRVTKQYLRALNDLSAEFNIPYNMHILETRLQRVLGNRLFGKSLIRYVHDEGVLTQRALVIHAIWVDEDDMDIMAESGCSIAHNPLCNLKLGSGIMPFRALSERGINICLGSDEMCSDDSVNMWNVAKLGGLVHKITDSDYSRWPNATEILSCATTNGARSLGLGTSLGSVAVGQQADLLLLDLDALPFTPLNDLRRQLVFCESGTSVRLTIVAGEIVASNGKLTTIDEDGLRAEIRELWKVYQKQYQAVDHWARKLEPVYRKMYERCLQENIDLSRRLQY